MSANEVANGKRSGDWQDPAHYKLEVWQEAMDLVKAVYRLTATMPGSERFNLTEQIQRSAVSVPSNIAEGAGRGSKPDFVRFLLISRGSLMELDTQLRIAAELEMLRNIAPINQAILRLLAKLNGLIRNQRKPLIRQSNPS